VHDRPTSFGLRRSQTVCDRRVYMRHAEEAKAAKKAAASAKAAAKKDA
jgi:hypothetical protein